jgi:serine/threonine protein phosphatase PrpC
MKATVGVRTDIGRARQRNEDAYLVRTPVFAVADGMGGHQGGEVASTLAVEALGELDLRADGVMEALVQSIREANGRVLERGEGDPALRGMGTTLTALVTDQDRAHLAHVGDSRAYLLRKGSLQQLTEDHTLVQRMVREGRLTPEEAERHPQRSVITRALGVEDEVPVDELTLPLLDGDRLLLCTDGLTGMVGEARIHEILGSEPDPQAVADRLVEEANGAGGEDNITAIVVFFEERNDAEPRPKDTGSPAPLAAGDGAAGTGAEPSPPRRHRWRRLVVWVAVLALLASGAFVGIRSYVNRQWYVGVSDGEVAIFNGVPTSVLGYELSSAREPTGIPADQAMQFEAWKGLDDGITAGTLVEARSIVKEIRSDLERAATETP